MHWRSSVDFPTPVGPTTYRWRRASSGVSATGFDVPVATPSTRPREGSRGDGGSTRAPARATDGSVEPPSGKPTRPASSGAVMGQGHQSSGDLARTSSAATQREGSARRTRRAPGVEDARTAATSWGSSAGFVAPMRTDAASSGSPSFRRSRRSGVRSRREPGTGVIIHWMTAAPEIPDSAISTPPATVSGSASRSGSSPCRRSSTANGTAGRGGPRLMCTPGIAARTCPSTEASQFAGTAMRCTISASWTATSNTTAPVPSTTLMRFDVSPASDLRALTTPSPSRWRGSVSANQEVSLPMRCWRTVRTVRRAAVPPAAAKVVSSGNIDEVLQ